MWQGICFSQLRDFELSNIKEKITLELWLTIAWIASAIIELGASSFIHPSNAVDSWYVVGYLADKIASQDTLYPNQYVLDVRRSIQDSSTH